MTEDVSAMPTEAAPPGPAVRAAGPVAAADVARRPGPPSGRSAVRHGVTTAAVVAASFSATAVLAHLVAYRVGNITAFAAVQSLVGLPAVVALIRWRSLSATRIGLRPVPWTLAPACVAYLATPASWAGTALFWWRVLDPSVLAFALDLVVWSAAAVLGVLWGSAPGRVRPPAPAQSPASSESPAPSVPPRTPSVPSVPVSSPYG